MVAASATPAVAGAMNLNVEEGRQEAGQGFDADVGQRVVALHRDQRAGGQREEPDDRRRSRR